MKMKMKMINYVIATGMALCLCIIQNTYAQTNNTETNTTRSYMNCYSGSMTTFLLQIMFSPPEIKFNITDLMSP